MNIAKIIVRTLMGLLFLLASVIYLLNLAPPPDDLPEKLKAFNEGMAASGYLMTLVKVTELVCAIALLSGRFVPLALVILSPIIINIFFVHLLLERSGLPIAIFLILAQLFLAYCYRDSFKELVKP